MHRTTIVQNKILSTIRSCFFFCPANIYRRNLGRERLGRPNPKVNNALNFYLRRKKKIPFYSELYRLQLLKPDFQISF